MAEGKEEPDEQLAVRWSGVLCMMASQSARQRTTALTTIKKLLQNIVDHPDDARFRVVKLKNKAISSRIVSVQGGVEVLRLAGFRRATTNLEPCMCFDEEGGLANVAWVLNAVTEYLSGDDFLAAKEGCLLQIKLPSGRSIRGSFTPQETVRDVFEFVRAASGISKPFKLCCPFPVTEFEEASHGALSVEVAGLVPSSSLLVSLGVRVGAPGEFEHPADMEQEYKAQVEAPAEAIRKARIEKRQQRDDQRKQREALLAEFRADREDQKERALMRQPAAAPKS